MQMVNCSKCGKPIDHTHFYKLKDKQIEHVDCNNPTPTAIRFFVKKELPDFTWELKGRSKTV